VDPVRRKVGARNSAGTSRIMRVVRLMEEPDWQSRLSPIEEIFFATSPSAKTLRPDERQPFKERWLGRYIAYDIESFISSDCNGALERCRCGFHGSPVSTTLTPSASSFAI
jgi:hypothetical protein